MRKLSNDYNCARWGGHPTTWDGLFNNDTKYWEDLLHHSFTFEHHMHCMSQWNHSATYRTFGDEIVRVVS